MKIDKALISKLETLARLELSEQEQLTLQKDLNKILTMVAKLEEVDTEGVEPLIHMSGTENVWRADEIKNQIPRETALKNAPQEDGQYFLVPKVIQKG